MLSHIHPGDRSAEALRSAHAPGKVYVWTDVLHEGPVRAAWSDAERVAARAAVLDRLTGGGHGVAALQARLEAQDRDMDQALQAREAVLWFDACLYDQLILIHLLTTLGGRPSEASLSLICIGSFRGIPAFHGLGQLDPQQLASLLPSREPVTPAQFDLAAATWQAFGGADPLALAKRMDEDLSALPFLRDALLRLMAQFPSPADGLNRSERAILTALSTGPASLIELFGRVSATEARPFFGDTTLFAWVDELAGGDEPLVRVEGPGPLPLRQPSPAPASAWQCRLTPAGQAALAGRSARRLLAGRDRWIGGTHLTRDHVWTFDPDRRRLSGPAGTATVADRDP